MRSQAHNYISDQWAHRVVSLLPVRTTTALLDHLYQKMQTTVALVCARPREDHVQLPEEDHWVAERILQAMARLQALLDTLELLKDARHRLPDYLKIHGLHVYRSPRLSLHALTY